MGKTKKGKPGLEFRSDGENWFWQIILILLFGFLIYSAITDCC